MPIEPRRTNVRSSPAMVESPPRRQPTYAAIDLGTNNCRLLIARPSRDGFRVVDAFSRIVRLGEGIGESGLLSEAAMDRTIDALRVCARKMRRRGVDRTRSVATDVCRRARNCTQFFARVREETGLVLETISSVEEARLALGGCLPLLDPESRHAIVFDIGGGSTEVSFVDMDDGRPRMAGSVSLPVGVVNLSERHGGERLTRGQYDAMVAEVDAGLAPFCTSHRIAKRTCGGGVQMLGTSGTVTTLTGIHLDLTRYDRSRVDGATLEFDTICEISDSLRAMACAERARHPCIGPERADLVVAGCAILAAMCRRWPVGRLRVADRGLREGILMDMLEYDGLERAPRRSP